MRTTLLMLVWLMGCNAADTAMNATEKNDSGSNEPGDAGGDARVQDAADEDAAMDASVMDDAGGDARTQDAAGDDAAVDDAAVDDAAIDDAGTTPIDPEQRARNDYLRSRLEAHLASSLTPGLGAALVIEGEVAAIDVVGVRSVESDAPVRLGDYFMVKSCTKPMTGHLVARLIQEAPPIEAGSSQLLSWDTRLLDVFPELSAVADPAYTNTTIANLMSHSSGMPYQPLNEPTDEYASVTSDLRERRVLYVEDAVLDAPVNPSPYGGGSIIVAAMLERVMGQPWEELMYTYVFDDLGMTNAGFGEDPYPPSTRATVSHTMSVSGPEVWTPPATYAEEVHAPAGRNAHASIADVARFIASHLPNASQRPGTLTREQALAAHTPVTGTGFTSGGWSVMAAPWNGALDVLSHNGTDGKDYSLMLVSASEDVAMVFMSNYQDDALIWALPNEAYALMRHYDMASVFDASVPAAASASATDVFTPVSGHEADKAIDGSLLTRWATNNDVREAALTIDLGEPRSISEVHIAEAYEYPRVLAFVVSHPRASDGGEVWEPLATGTTIGPHRAVTFDPIVTDTIRVEVTEANGPPTLSEVWAH